MLAGDLGRRTGRSQSYPSSSLGVPRQVLTHGAVNLTFRGGQIFGRPPLLQRYGGGSAALQHSDEQCRHTRMAPSTALRRVQPPPHATLLPLGVLLAADGHREGNAPAQTIRRAEASTVGALGRASAGPHLCGASQRSTPSCRRGVCLAKCSSARPTHFPLRKRSGMKCPAPLRQL